METINRQFGLTIAFLLPGFIGLGGIALVVPTVARWLAPIPGQSDAGLGAPVYAVLAATATGMIISVFRWIVIDHLHHWSGVKPPTWNLATLEYRLDAFNYVVEGSYRYYQAHANMLVAVVWTYSFIRWMNGFPFLGFGTDLGVVILCAALFAGSRDALLKYYSRSNQLVGWVAEKVDRGESMTNGFHPDGGNKGTNHPKETKPAEKQLAAKRPPVKESKKDQTK